MAEDVKTLREAACAIPGGGMLSACERAALSILCARMADMIEREGAPLATGHFDREVAYFERMEKSWIGLGKKGMWVAIRKHGTHDCRPLGFWQSFEEACGDDSDGCPRADGHTLIREVGAPKAEWMSAVVLNPTPAALQAAEDRGWNVALLAAIAAVNEMAGHYSKEGGTVSRQDALVLIRALRREPRP